MNEYLYEANEELKRADHLVFVSLKYTRTVDVIKNIINRLISVYELLINALLLTLYKKKSIEKIPETPLAKAELIKKIFANDQKMLENINLYILLRQISKAPYESGKEYRRYVTMTAKLKDKTIDINIDTIHEYYDKISDFFDYVKKIIEQ